MKFVLNIFWWRISSYIYAENFSPLTLLYFLEVIFTVLCGILAVIHQRWIKICWKLDCWTEVIILQFFLKSVENWSHVRVGEWKWSVARSGLICQVKEVANSDQGCHRTILCKVLQWKVPSLLNNGQKSNTTVPSEVWHWISFAVLAIFDETMLQAGTMLQDYNVTGWHKKSRHVLWGCQSFYTILSKHWIHVFQLSSFYTILSNQGEIKPLIVCPRLPFTELLLFATKI